MVINGESINPVKAYLYRESEAGRAEPITYIILQEDGSGRAVEGYWFPDGSGWIDDGTVAGQRVNRAGIMTDGNVTLPVWR